MIKVVAILSADQPSCPSFVDMHYLLYYQTCSIIIVSFLYDCPLSTSPPLHLYVQTVGQGNWKVIQPQNLVKYLLVANYRDIYFYVFADRNMSGTVTEETPAATVRPSQPGELTEEVLAALRNDFYADDKNRLAQNVCSRSDPLEACLQRRWAVFLDPLRPFLYSIYTSYVCTMYKEGRNWFN